MAGRIDLHERERLLQRLELARRDVAAFDALLLAVSERLGEDERGDSAEVTAADKRRALEIFGTCYRAE